MRSGMTLQEMATELQRRAELKRDFVAKTAALRFEPADNGLTLTGINGGMPVGPIAHEHLSANLSIPMPYYRRLLENDPRLLAANVNRWLEEEPERRLVRTLDGEVRAIVSDTYRPMEYEQLAEAVLPVLMDLNLEVMSCNVTERKMYIKAVSADIRKDMPAKWRNERWGQGHEIFDTLSPAIVISNSEVRCGSLSIQTSILTRQCTNLATFAERSVRKVHIGKRLSADDETWELMSDATKELDDRALWAKVKDITRAAFNVAEFDKLALKLQDAGQDSIPNDADVPAVVERIGKKLALTEGERTGVLNFLIQGGDLTRYGVHAAITRYSQEVENYDRATDLELAGGQIIEMPKKTWKEALAV